MAAQQCGVNARIIYLQPPKHAQRGNSLDENDVFLINPHIVGRSPEMEMRVWREECLVLPPSFRATVLRDAWIEVDSWDPRTSTVERRRLTGEQARAFQHEYDHDRGILITDHVDLQELETETMQTLERPGHESRMQVAYTRHLDEPLL